MKLPEKRSERLKLIGLIVVVVLAAFYGVYVAVSGHFARVREQATKIDELKRKLEAAQTAVKQMERDLGANAMIVDSIINTALRQGGVLRDRLGNYLLSAQEILETYAKRSNVSLDTITEVGISQLPQMGSKGQAGNFRGYTVRVGLQCGLHELVRLFANIETNNPYVSVLGLSIVGQPDKPDRHSVSFEIQWPIWADTSLPAMLETQVQQNAGGMLTNSPALSVVGGEERS